MAEPLVTPPPRTAWLAFSLAAALIGLPLLGLVVRAPWARLPSLLAGHEAQQALGLSLGTCLVSTAVVVVLGVPTSLVLARSTGRWVQVARTLFSLPMVLPPVVAGLALLATFGRWGVVGRPLSHAGIEIGFTTTAVVISQVFVSLPFMIGSLEAALRTSGTHHEVVAAGLGANPLRVFLTVTVPMAAPSIGAAAALAFARALGEFGATLTFAGSLPGVTRTLPLEIYLLRESDSDLSLALSLVLLVVAAVLVVATSRWSGNRG
ncbi:ABC transporter permease [Aestuariimicrobium kwangyangense]|uniref:ABC transporter permease n=1 Tax=Aestuariimicrobium kwangyangense TaxID=396389 RepID=UPI0003B578A0|nr:ABC transporter permease [Aestuariimicrobium kwangyangense]